VVAGASCIVSDDGLQHYRLQRDLEFAVLDAGRMIGNGCLLPAGPLREPPARLAEVDLLFINGDPAPDQGVGFTLQAEDLTSLGDGRRLPLAHFSGQRVWAVAGIGNPQRFYDSLRDAGIKPMPVEIPDHGRTDLQALSRESAQPILMTEKDAVKYSPDVDVDAWYLPVRAELSAAALAALQEQLARLWPQQAASVVFSSASRGA
jgi:tetraacyldisaccharide 4'-kinase